jgi:hypothetical protein
VKLPTVHPAEYYRDPAQTVRYPREIAQDAAKRALERESRKSGDKYHTMARRAALRASLRKLRGFDG